MRIAIITGHFMPEIGYQEVYLARALSKLNNKVTVFTSGKISPLKRKIIKTKKYNIGESTDHENKYRIVRLKSYISVGSMIVCRGLKKKVDIFNPDLKIVIGLGKIFPFPILTMNGRRETKTITLMGNNQDYYTFLDFKGFLNYSKNRFLEMLVKKWVYRRAVKFSDLVVTYTEDTESIVEKFLSSNLKKVFTKKLFRSTLGFDLDEFYFKSEDYFNIRSEYGIPEDAMVVVTSTRINKNKKIEFIIENIAKLQKAGINVYYIIIGFLNDQYAEKLKKMISNLEQKEKFICLPFLPHSEIRKIYCAADLGIWLQAAISIQEAMGTGLPVLLEDKGSVKHLIKESQNGFLFEKSQFYNVLEKYVYHLINISVDQRLSEKENISKFNKKRISYEAIVKKMLESPVLKE